MKHLRRQTLGTSLALALTGSGTPASWAAPTAPTNSAASATGRTNDGTLVVYSSATSPLWATHTRI